MIAGNKIEISAEFADLFSNELSDQNKVDALVLAAKFLEIINNELEEKEITRKRLAEMLGKSGSWLTQLFRGDKLPNLETLAHISNVLEISFDIKNTSRRQTIEEVNSEIIDNLRKFENKKSTIFAIVKPDWSSVSDDAPTAHDVDDYQDAYLPMTA